MTFVSKRPAASRPFTSGILTAVAAATLGLMPLADARAQEAMRHGAQHGKAHRASHGGHGASASDQPSVAEFKTAHARMMAGMDQSYTGDADVDFRVHMIPHHQGAIDMARVALRHAEDPWTRQLVEAVIIEQQREIADMQAWLARRGVAASMSQKPQQTLTATSYRTHTEEPGTPDEALGQSWAPGSGVPSRR